MKTNKPHDIDEYIAGFPKDIQKILEQVRVTVKKAAPGAEETIKYAMPAFTFKGNLVFFAAFKNHIGFYPAPTGNVDFKKALSGYKTGKGSVQFPLNKPMPLSLITRIVKFRVKKNSEEQGIAGDKPDSNKQFREAEYQAREDAQKSGDLPEREANKEKQEKK